MSTTPVLIQCIRCRRDFRRPYDLKRHYNRKHPCQPIWSPRTGENTETEYVVPPDFEKWISSKLESLELSIMEKTEEMFSKYKEDYMRLHSRRNMPPLWEERRGFGEEKITHIDEIKLSEIFNAKEWQILGNILKAVHFSRDQWQNANVFCPNWRIRILFVWETDNNWHRVTFEDWWSSWISLAKDWLTYWLDNDMLELSYRDIAEKIIMDLDFLEENADELELESDEENLTGRGQMIWSMADAHSQMRKTQGLRRKFIKIKSSFLHELAFQKDNLLHITDTA